MTFGVRLVFALAEGAIVSLAARSDNALAGTVAVMVAVGVPVVWFVRGLDPEDGT